MNKTPVEIGTSILRPKARLIKTIGEELISNDIVAIIELVKNSYDANSPIVTVSFNGMVELIKEDKVIRRVLKKENAFIEIYDEGIGMDLNIIKGAWMEPATTFKKNSKNSNPNRRFTGEKGIGRFASAKLGNNLTIITKKEDDNEIIVKFKWNDFSDDIKYLDEVKTEWEVRVPQKINRSGTILILEDLIIDWHENKLRELRTALSRLLSPIAPTEDFLIELQLPIELDDLSGLIERPETLNKPDYYIKGSISDNGFPDLKYYSKNEGVEKELKVKIEEFKLKGPARPYELGGFNFEFRVWNRDSSSIGNLAKEINSSVKNIKSDLDDLAGISVYRDNIRVLPYGNKNDDWLRLDIRRVNNPTKNLSNNQIVGYVSVSLDTNPLLKDQSNREGIVESQAFDDLKEYIKLILNELEVKRYNERPRENEAGSANIQSLFQRFSLNSIVQYIKEKLPLNSEVLEIVQNKEKDIQEGVKKVQEVLSRYRRLTTLGQLIDVILHDGGNYLGRIDGQANLIVKDINKKELDVDKIRGYAENILEVRENFALLFKRIEPFGGRRRGRPKNIIVEEVIENQFQLAHNEIENQGIKYILPSSQNSVTIDEAELGIIIMNLLQNSIYWLSTNKEEKIIEIQVNKDGEELTIIFSDNGPGIREDSLNSIFDPYFSTRPDGIGLGLTIIGELVSEYNGELSLVSNGPLEGATFKITFKYRI